MRRLRRWSISRGSHGRGFGDVRTALLGIILAYWLVAMPFLGWDAYQDGVRIDKVGVSTSGRVVDASSGRGDPWETVDVEIDTPSGVERTSVTGYAFEFYERGQQVLVEYDPDDIERARLRGSNSEFVSTIALGAIVGMVASLWAAVLLSYIVLNRLRPVRGRRVP